MKSRRRSNGGRVGSRVRNAVDHVHIDHVHIDVDGVDI